MYHTCIFCSANLGRNEAIETFPVGGRLAFDAWKGRLWVICRRCLRWNLAPIEERWEAVEDAERRFRDARTRVQTENIGLARLPDGTRLVRVGQALPGELAAWRYGDRLVQRRRQYVWGGVASVVAGTALVAGAPLITAAGIPFTLVTLGLQAASWGQIHRDQQRVLLRLGSDETAAGRALLLRSHHVHRSRVLAAGDSIKVLVPDALEPPPLKRVIGGPRHEPLPLEITGERAERLVARAVVRLNGVGGSRRQVSEALALLGEAGSARAFLGTLQGEGVTLARRTPPARAPGLQVTARSIVQSFRGEVVPITRYRSPWSYSDYPILTQVQSLALEMALNDDAERRALEGELAALEAAWREAEEIAAIADALPDESAQPSS